MSNLKEYILIGLAALILVVFGYVGIHSNLAVLSERINTLSLVTATSKPSSTVAYPPTTNVYPSSNTSNTYPTTTGEKKLGAADNLTAIPGICTGGEPVTQLCNVNIKSLNVSRSYEPFSVGNISLTVATGTPNVIYTNSSGADMMCSGALGATFASTTAGFTPSIVYSIGTTTSATGYSTTLIASTTIATSTTETVTAFTYTKNFLLKTGQSIVSWFSDSAQVAASTGSSTNFSLILVKPVVPCWLMGQ